MSEREKLRIEARKLRGQGLTYREVAERMGLKTPKVAWALVNPGALAAIEKRRRAAKREWDRKNYRRSCPRCGGDMDAHPASEMCADCHRTQQREDADADHRNKIVQMWDEGASLREIGESLNWSQGHLAAEFGRMRELGYDLPYRYKMKDGKRVAA